MNSCPAFGGSPLTYQALIESGSSRLQHRCSGSAAGKRQSLAIRSETGKPFCAYCAAGSSTSLKVSVPKRWSTACQPQTVPGTVTGRIPYIGMPELGPQFLGSAR